MKDRDLERLKAELHSTTPAPSPDSRPPYEDMDKLERRIFWLQFKSAGVRSVRAAAVVLLYGFLVTSLLVGAVWLQHKTYLMNRCYEIEHSVLTCLTK